MLSHTTLVPVPAPGVGSPGGVALLAGAGEAAHGVGTDGVATAVVGKVPVSALIHIHTALVGSVVTIASVTVTSPAPHSVHTGGQGSTVGRGRRVDCTLVNIRTTCDILANWRLITSFCFSFFDHQSDLLISTIFTTHSTR